MTSPWRGAARLIAGAFGAFTNGLTSSMPAGTKPDKNVDMLIGGQAVIEGVMMRSLTGYSVAVRQPDGGVSIRKDKLVSIAARYPFLKVPVLRGSVVLIQSLILGMRALNYSASVATENPFSSVVASRMEYGRWSGCQSQFWPITVPSPIRPRAVHSFGSP